MALFANEKKLKTEEQQLAGTVTLIGNGTQIIGDLMCIADIRLDGTIKGNTESKSKLVIGATGALHGNAVAQSADISGIIEGNLIIAETLFLKATAKINGDITTNKLIIENGAIFNGRCVMGNVVNTRTVKNGSLTEEAFA